MREVVGMFSRPSVTVQSSCGDSCSSLHLPDAAKFEPPLRRLNGAGTVVTSAPALQVPAAVGTAVGTASASGTCQAPFRIELTQLPMEPSRTLVSSRMLALVLYCWSLHKAFFVVTFMQCTTSLSFVPQQERLLRKLAMPGTAHIVADIVGPQPRKAVLTFASEAEVRPVRSIMDTLCAGVCHKSVTYIASVHGTEGKGQVQGQGRAGSAASMTLNLSLSGACACVVLCCVSSASRTGSRVQAAATRQQSISKSNASRVRCWWLDGC